MHRDAAHGYVLEELLAWLIRNAGSQGGVRSCSATERPRRKRRILALHGVSNEAKWARLTRVYSVDEPASALQCKT